MHTCTFRIDISLCAAWSFVDISIPGTRDPLKLNKVEVFGVFSEWKFGKNVEKFY